MGRAGEALVPGRRHVHFDRAEREGLVSVLRARVVPAARKREPKENEGECRS